MRVDYYHTFYPHMGSGHFGGLIFLLLIILVIFLLYKIYQYKKGSPCCSTTKSSMGTTLQHNSSPLEILETRLVNGEINVEEFLTMKKAMQTEFIIENKNQE